MSQGNLLANRPLARAAFWFLVDAGIVLAVLCGVVLRPDVMPDDFHHPGLLRAGLIKSTGIIADSLDSFARTRSRLRV